MAPATLIIHRKLRFDDGATVEVKVWRVPASVPGPSHSFKYSLFYGLFYGRPGERIVAYDNEAGKGDHRHYGDREEAYVFRGINELLADFEAEVERARRKG